MILHNGNPTHTFVHARNLLVRNMMLQFLLVIGDDIAQEVGGEKVITNTSGIESKAPIIVALLCRIG